MSSNGFKDVYVNIPINLLPSRLENIKESVQESLNSLLMRYVNAVRGVVVCYDKVKVKQDLGTIFYDRPHVSFNVDARFLVFSPVVGSHLVGVVNSVTHDHISLLVHGVFNVALHAKTGIPNSFKYNKELEYWSDDVNKQTIEVGSKVTFKVEEIENATSMHLIGSINEASTCQISGPIKTISSTKSSMTTSLLSHVFSSASPVSSKKGKDKSNKVKKEKGEESEATSKKRNGDKHEMDGDGESSTEGTQDSKKKKIKEESKSKEKKRKADEVDAEENKKEKKIKTEKV